MNTKTKTKSKPKPQPPAKPAPPVKPKGKPPTPAPAPADITPVYTHRDRSGLGWRMAGSRPVSALADQVMQECGLPLAQ